jgi:uncharacterized phage-associated protein
MASVLDVAATILRKRGRMTTMKLQKLAYYSQAFSLVWDGKPLFQERFEAWASGPVCPALHRVIHWHFTVTEEDIPGGDPSRIKKKQMETIDAVLKHYGGKPTDHLLMLTQIESPWKDARDGYSPGEDCTKVITWDSMKEYYQIYV